MIEHPNDGMNIDADLLQDHNLNEALKNPDIVARVRELRRENIKAEGKTSRKRAEATKTMDDLLTTVAYAQGDPIFKKALVEKLRQALGALEK